MRVMHVTALSIARTFIGTSELPGAQDNPLIMAMLQSVAGWPEHDEVAWCSSFPSFVCDLLRLPTPKQLDWSMPPFNGVDQSLRARAWLRVGVRIPLAEAEPGFDLAIFKRGPAPQPGPDIIMAPGHVGWFAGLIDDRVLCLGGNQSNAINVRTYPVEDLLAIQRVWV